MRIGPGTRHYKVSWQISRKRIQHEQIPASSRGNPMDRLDCAAHLRSGSAAAFFAGGRAGMAAKAGVVEVFAGLLGGLVSDGAGGAAGGGPFWGGGAAGGDSIEPSP